MSPKIWVESQYTYGRVVVWWTIVTLLHSRGFGWLFQSFTACLDRCLRQAFSSSLFFSNNITDLRPTDHLPSVAELRPRKLPDKTDTTRTYNRQTTDNLLGRDLSNMFERSLPDKFVCLNINRHQTNKTESIQTVNQPFPEFDDFCRFEVGFVLVWPETTHTVIFYEPIDGEA